MLLPEDLEVENGSIPNLIIIIHQAPLQQHHDAGEKTLARGTKLSKGSHGSWEGLQIRAWLLA